MNGGKHRESQQSADDGPPQVGKNGQDRLRLGLVIVHDLIVPNWQGAGHRYAGSNRVAPTAITVGGYIKQFRRTGPDNSRRVPPNISRLFAKIRQSPRLAR